MLFAPCHQLQGWKGESGALWEDFELTRCVATPVSYQQAAKASYLAVLSPGAPALPQHDFCLGNSALQTTGAITHQWDRAVTAGHITLKQDSG